MGEGTKQSAIVLNQAQIAKLRLAGRFATIRSSESMQAAANEFISEELRGRFHEAKNVLVLTGAGVSAESGVPTFRGGGNTAVWQGMPFEVISSAGKLARELPRVWGWVNFRPGLLEKLEPHLAHCGVAQGQDRFQNFNLVTQNIHVLHPS